MGVPTGARMYDLLNIGHRVLLWADLPLVFLRGKSLVQCLLVKRQILVCQLSILERNHAIFASRWTTAFNYVAFETVSPGVRTFITEFSSHTLTPFLHKVVFV